MRFVPVDHRKTDAAVVNDGMNAIREFFLLPVDTDSSKHRTNVSRLSHADIFLDCPTKKNSGWWPRYPTQVSYRSP